MTERVKPQLPAEIDALKATIRDAVERAVDKFRYNTGIAPSAIDIEMIDVTPLGRLHKTYSVGEVRVRLDV